MPQSFPLVYLFSVIKLTLQKFGVAPVLIIRTSEVATTSRFYFMCFVFEDGHGLETRAQSRKDLRNWLRWRMIDTLVVSDPNRESIHHRPYIVLVFDFPVYPGKKSGAQQLREGALVGKWPWGK